MAIPQLALLAGNAAVNEAMRREMRRKAPFAQSTGGAPNAPSDKQIALMEQLDKRADSPAVMVEYADPAKGQISDMASNQRLVDKDTREDIGYGVSINPNVDNSFFAHELGHIASDRTNLGHIVRVLRDNPKLAAALKGAQYIAPGAAAFAIEGTDDADEALALGLLAAAPTLADEAMATRQGLGLMQDAGMRATPGQRARLAGGLLTYMGAPIVAALGGNVVGNALGQDY